MTDKICFAKLRTAILFGSVILFSAPVFAENKAMLDLLLLLKNKGSISAHEYEVLVDAAKADGKQAAASARQAGNLPRINTRGKLELKSEDGRHKFRIGGRLNHDFTAVGGDGDYSGSSAHQFRRARLYLSGTTFKLWDFKFQYDFEDLDDNSHGIEDAYFKYKGWPVHITLGQRKTPYSMMGLTSSKYLAFIERSIASELFNAGSIGVGNKAPGITFTWNDQKNSGLLLEGGYYFLRQRNDGGQIGEGSLDDHGLSARLVWGQYDAEARTLLSAGVSGGFRNYENGIVNRFRVRPGVAIGDGIVSSSDPLTADSYSSFNFNAAAMYKNFWAGGEYYSGNFDLPNSGDDGMQGFDLQAGVFLTPEDSRRYRKGVWDSVKPRNPVSDGGIGAWEVALRYDGVELDAGLSGGMEQEGNTFGAALNWYPINNIRFQANYITTDCGNSAQCAWGTGEPEFFVLRSQIFF